MPNIKSSKKDVISSKIAYEKNKANKSALKTDLKKFDAALESGDKAAAEVAYKAAVKAVKDHFGHCEVIVNDAGGEKGTGKTSYIKHLVNLFPNRKFVYVPASMITLLGEPSFGSFLITLNNHVIILEDCENAIRDRKESGSASAVSLLLNMTDGLLSDDLGMKFICTFNEDMKNIDGALLRKGRLMSKYEFKELAVPKAEAILRERGIETTLNKPITLAEIFHYGEAGYDTVKKSII